MWGLLAGGLALIGLDAVVQSKGAANFGAVLGFASKVVAWFIDPTVPGIPTLASSTPASPATPPTATTSANTTTAPPPQASTSPAVSGVLV